MKTSSTWGATGFPEVKVRFPEGKEERTPSQNLRGGICGERRGHGLMVRNWQGGFLRVVKNVGMCRHKEVATPGRKKEKGTS